MLPGIVVDVIALRIVGVRRAGFAGLDGDLSVVAQGHDQVVVQRLVDVHGERRFDVLGHRGLVGRDGDLDQVAFVAGVPGSSVTVVLTGVLSRVSCSNLPTSAPATVAIDCTTGGLLPV
nr:hypothetical protein [Pseudomonas monteilii]